MLCRLHSNNGIAQQPTDTLCTQSDLKKASIVWECFSCYILQFYKLGATLMSKSANKLGQLAAELIIAPELTKPT